MILICTSENAAVFVKDLVRLETLLTASVEENEFVRNLGKDAKLSTKSAKLSEFENNLVPANNLCMIFVMLMDCVISRT